MLFDIETIVQKCIVCVSVVYVCEAEKIKYARNWMLTIEKEKNIERVSVWACERVCVFEWIWRLLSLLFSFYRWSLLPENRLN